MDTSGILLATFLFFPGEGVGSGTGGNNICNSVREYLFNLDNSVYPLLLYFLTYVRLKYYLFLKSEYIYASNPQRLPGRRVFSGDQGGE